MSESIDTADVVLHQPTGEEWVVACVEGNRLMWVGWPEGWANLSDCILIRKATREKYIWWLREMARMTNKDDRRGRYARRKLNELEGGNHE